MAQDPTDSIDLALDELANEPLPERTRDHSTPPPEDEVEIAYADDDGGAPAPAAQAPAPERPREIPAEEGIEALRARLQASEAATREANARAQQAEQARVAAATGAQQSDVQFLETALSGVKQGLTMLKGALAEAYSVQDFAQVAEIQTEIARTAQREQQIEIGLEQLKATPPPRAAAPPPSTQDQVEFVVSRVAQEGNPNSANWLRAHPEYVTNPRMNAKLVGAHNFAVAEGLAADTPEYIAYVEDKLGLRGSAEPPPQAFTQERTPVADSRPRAPPPAAPVSRANGGSNPTRVTLTREQREMARELFPDEMAEDPSGRKSEQAYARNMLILRREKRLN